MKHPSNEDFEKLNLPDGPEDLKEEFTDKGESIERTDNLGSDNRIYLNSYKELAYLTEKEMLLQISLWINVMMINGNDRRHK